MIIIPKLYKLTTSNIRSLLYNIVILNVHLTLLFYSGKIFFSFVYFYLCFLFSSNVKNSVSSCLFLDIFLYVGKNHFITSSLSKSSISL